MTQAQFAQAILDPDAPLPPGIVDPFGAPAPKRFSVYRNTVVLSLTRVLEAGFPTVRLLVGEAFFAAMAADFVRQLPPRSRILMLYGDALPGWLERFPPTAHLGYLPDVARLDQAMRESYHAADSQPVAEAEFKHLLGQDISRLRLQLAPSLRLVRSFWPVVSIWCANHEAAVPPAAGAETALVLRPDFSPRPQCLSDGAGKFVAGLLAGKTLGESVDLAGEAFDLSGVLGQLIAGRAIIGVTS